MLCLTLILLLGSTPVLSKPMQHSVYSSMDWRFGGWTPIHRPLLVPEINTVYSSSASYKVHHDEEDEFPHVKIPVVVETDFDKVLDARDLFDIQQHVTRIIPRVTHIVTHHEPTQPTNQVDDKEFQQLNSVSDNNFHSLLQLFNQEEEEEEEDKGEEHVMRGENREERSYDVIHLIANQKTIPTVVNVDSLLSSKDGEETLNAEASTIELVDGAGHPNFNNTHAFHAFYASSQRAAPPGYTKLSLSQFRNIFKDASILNLSSNSSVNETQKTQSKPL